LRSLAQPDQDDGFHEIQLNGKQLVFLFMAATVVSVAIFLCGVLVGRGVRAEQASVGPAAGAALPVAALRPASSREQDAVGPDPVAAPPATGDDLTYVNRLESRGKTSEKIASPSRPPAHEAGAKSSGKPAVDGPNAAPAAGGPAAGPASALTEPSGAGFTLQVTALRERSEAEAIAKRLTAKGYSAYVMKPTSGAVYRVRIGKFKTRHDAEAIADKLQKEEQFTPWITR
jgi:cell division septation protein DedD